MGTTKNIDLIRSRNSVSCLYVHLVFVSKYRRRIFTGEMLKAMEAIFCDACAVNDARLVEFDGEPDHTHALI